MNHYHDDMWSCIVICDHISYSRPERKAEQMLCGAEARCFGQWIDLTHILRGGAGYRWITPVDLNMPVKVGINTYVEDAVDKWWSKSVIHKKDFVK